MKKKIHSLFAFLLSSALLLSFAACGTSGNNSGNGNSGSSSGTEIVTPADDSSSSDASSGTSEEPATDTSVSASETTDGFAISVADGGTYTLENNVYTLTSAGTYTFSGALTGQILVEAGEEDEVVVELAGVTIEYSKDSPIKAVSADKVEISAKSGTENVIKDTRSVKTTEDDSQGEGAISADVDLKLKGKGTLVVTGNYNNGVHTTKDLTIKNLSLKSTAVNNAIKGKDSITVESGTVVAISTNGDGMKTTETDVNKNGETRGDITLTGGNIAVYAAGDGFQAAHDFIMQADDEGNTPTVSVYTGSYSSYTASGASTTSYKGVKAQNVLSIAAGSITLKTYDDGLHADYGTAFDDGTKGQGTILISGGTVSINVYSPENKTAGGRMGPGFGSWGSQQTVSGADAIHADYALTISGGTVEIDSSYEGLEGNVITISGGKTIVAGNDDGVNACSGVKTPQIIVTGGILDVTVSPSGDTDGIDSNGTYTQSGGLVITRGPSNQNMAAIDADGSVTVSGGTIIILGYGSVRTSGSVKSYSLSLHSSGNHTVKVNGTSYTFTNAYTYGKTICYSDVSVSGS